MAKGIRVNQLAKELGVESKAILTKCREEGLGEKVPNHMSVLSVGLAETVREWFSGHVGIGDGGGTAVETAPPIETATKPKRPKIGSKKLTEESDAGDEPTSDEETSEPESSAVIVEDEAPIAPVTPPSVPAAAEPAVAARSIAADGQGCRSRSPGRSGEANHRSADDH